MKDLTQMLHKPAPTSTPCPGCKGSLLWSNQQAAPTHITGLGDSPPHCAVEDHLSAHKRRRPAIYSIPTDPNTSGPFSQ